MTDTGTIDDKLSSLSFGRNIMQGGKYLLAFVAIAYAANFVYNLGRLVSKDAEYNRLQEQAGFDALELLSYHRGLTDAGMSSEEVNQRFDERLSQLYAKDKRREVIQAINRFKKKAVNPFYSRWINFI